MRTTACSIQPAAAVSSAPYHASPYLRLDWFDRLVFLAFVGLIGSSDQWEDHGRMVLVGLFCLFGTYVVVGAIRHRIFLRNTLLLAWSFLGILHVALSYARWLPGAPVAFYSEYILRTGYFTILAYPATAAFFLLFTKVRAAGMLPILAKFCVLAALIAAFGTYVFPVYDGIWRLEGDDENVFGIMMASLNYGINNVAMLFWWGLVLLSRWRTAWMVAIVAIMGQSHSTQMLLVALFTAVLWLAPRVAKHTVLLSTAIVVGLPASAFFLVGLSESTNIDPNSIGRAGWWVESLCAVIANYGFGFGFGADSITDPQYWSRFAMEGKFAKMPLMVMHNSFVYVFYAMGVLGGLVFVIFHLKDLLPRQEEDRNMARHAVLMFVMVCVTLSVNVALESPNYALGVFWVYGYLLERNRMLCTSRPVQHAASDTVRLRCSFPARSMNRQSAGAIRVGLIRFSGRFH